MPLARLSIDTPLGAYALVAGPEGVTHFQDAGSAVLPPASGSADARAQRALEAARDLFEAYFAGACDALDVLTVRPAGTPFELRVWRALRDIPTGETASYAEIARRVGSPRAARAVGAANHRNPIAVAIPCHRVIGADGRLIGYAGGLERKRWLLDREAAWAREAHRGSAARPPGARPAPATGARVPSWR